MKLVNFLVVSFFILLQSVSVESEGFRQVGDFPESSDAVVEQDQGSDKGSAWSKISAYYSSVSSAFLKKCSEETQKFKEKLKRVFESTEEEIRSQWAEQAHLYQ
ncbi:hypothetical protein OIY81_2738 [Cryptosporidium canis]|uniref:Uncharacterized protein n=1 Tax=Cryptosporidium canis TaxID=195482 RepID=A0ABQ8P9B4_9CRYT|nr:hypothetical protein OIY81_2738 [Cryptosporidium canis]KAJ1609880.1 hypothetical protein OJ252_2070 [Cryptosporidium canis]